MAWAKVLNPRTTSRILLASATIFAAIGVLSTRLVLGVLIGDRHAMLVGAGALGWQWHEPGHMHWADRWGPCLLDRNDDPIEWWPMSDAGPGGDGVVAIPLWMPLGATLLPGVWLALRHRRRAGCCRFCNYDLAGLAPDAPCPECGRPSSAAARTNVSSTGDSA